MNARPVEWVLVIFYGTSAHRATYGRAVREPAGSAKYTKDYIQLSRTTDFVDSIQRVFPFDRDLKAPVPLVYKWPEGSANGALAWSADRLHLKWDITPGAPAAWKMDLAPADSGAETIPGDPGQLTLEAAEREFSLIAERGAGQPYLVAVKLRGEESTLHVRAYLRGADPRFAWADTAMLPSAIQDLADETSANSALAWSLFGSGGTPPTPVIESVLDHIMEANSSEHSIGELDPAAAQAAAAYLRAPGFGLFFDPSRNHDAWSEAVDLPDELAASAGAIASALDERYPPRVLGDAAAESTEVDPTVVAEYTELIDAGVYAVPDTTGTVRVRGGAQKAFANSVKSNYGNRCAVTGIKTAQFLVASHVVPWSEDPQIRLDPSNGICLSLMVDRAFESGYLLIHDDMTIAIDFERIGDDSELLAHLAPFHGATVASPVRMPPRANYLKRRRDLVDRLPR